MTSQLIVHVSKWRKKCDEAQTRSFMNCVALPRQFYLSHDYFLLYFICIFTFQSERSGHLNGNKDGNPFDFKLVEFSE